MKSVTPTPKLENQYNFLKLKVVKFNSVLIFLILKKLIIKLHINMKHFSLSRKMNKIKIKIKIKIGVTRQFFKTYLKKCKQQLD